MSRLECYKAQAVSLRMPVRITDFCFDHWCPFLLDLFPEGAALKHIEKLYGLSSAESNWRDILEKTVIAPPGNVRITPPDSEVAKIAQAEINDFSRQDILDHRKDFLDHLVKSGAAIGGATGATGAQGGAPLHHENVIDVILRYSDKGIEDVAEYLKREFLNTCMGNSDNHGRNTEVSHRLFCRFSNLLAQMK